MGAFTRIVLGGILLALIYKLIENKQEGTRRDIEVSQSNTLIEITDHCDQDGGKHCKNTCQKINATKMKPGGEFQFNDDAIDPSNPENQFQADDCDEGTKLIRVPGRLCTGGDDTLSIEQRGEVECTSDDCCIPKTCGSDIIYSLEDSLNYLITTNNLTENDRSIITSIEELSDSAKEILNEKINRDGYCPYQMTAVDQNTECIGGVDNHTGEDCTIDECCIPKTCANNWDNNDGSVWGSDNVCPSQRADTDNTMLKYPDDNPCDTCNLSDCCYEQSNFCIVQDVGGSGIDNTNVQSVDFPDGITSISFPNDINTSVDLTTNYFLSKDDISQTNIQNLLSFGSEDGNINSVNDFGIKCLDGFKYGMCSSTDASVDENTCKTHDNNQRECEAVGCSFTLGDRPRVDYSECGDEAGHNVIKVNNCINTCTADYTLSDDGINYFTQTPIADGSYRVNPDFYSNKLNTDNDYPYSQGEIQMDCYNHTGTGNTLQYKYNCEGGGSYFGVSELSNCNTTCSQLHDQGLRCGQNNIYDEDKADNISSYANFTETGDSGCCMSVTCDTLSNGQSVSCLPHQTRRPDSSESVASRENCCVNKTCSDFMDEYNELSDENVDNTNICLDGRTFNANRELTSAYLYQVSDDDAAKLTRMDEYRSGSANYDIGCCSSLTCGDWLDNNLENLGILDDDQKLSRASELCGDGKFFVENMFAGDMGETITEDSSCCVGESELTCSPTQELVSSLRPEFTIPGYTIPDGTEFAEKTFNMNTSSGGGEYSMVADNISCSDGFTPSDAGIKYECRINPSTGEGTYYLSGCNDDSVTLDTGSGDTSDRLCNLPTHLTNSIQVNGFSFDADNNIVNFNHFLGNQDQFSCNESTERPNFDVCPEDFTDMTISGCHYQDKPRDTGDTFYSDRFFRYSDHIHGEDRESSGHPCENLYNEEATDNHQDPANPDNTISGPPTGYRQELNEIADEIYRKDPSLANNLEAALNKMKGNVSNFSCKCPGEGDNECPDHERQVRFKYIFANDEDYYNDDNGFITNQQAINDPNKTYPLDEILNSGFTTVCEPGYYPYRGVKYDYCRPCEDLYKNNHPISAIAESFCDSGHMGDSGNVTNLLDIEHESGFMNSNYESNSNDISLLKTSRVLGDGTTQTNEDYGPYLGNLSEITDANNIDFMTTDNFTLGTRVCGDSTEGNTCPKEVKLYDYTIESTTEDSAFEKAKKWWRTYFNSKFLNYDNIDNSDILDVLSAPDQTSSTDDSQRYLLKSRVNDLSQAEIKDKLLENRKGFDNLNKRISRIFENESNNNNVGQYSTIRDKFYLSDTTGFSHPDYNLTNAFLDDYSIADDNGNTILNENADRVAGSLPYYSNVSSGYNASQESADRGRNAINRDIFNKYVPFSSTISDIRELKKENLLYRDSLKIEKNDGLPDQYISTVCNNNTSEVDYIPSFNGNEGECKECVNIQPDDSSFLNGINAPKHVPGQPIIRNINDAEATPICSYEADMYNENYNEGNIVGFKSKTSGEIYKGIYHINNDETLQGPCEDGFIYNKFGTPLYSKSERDRDRSINKTPRKYIQCYPEIPKYTTSCELITNEDCNKYITGNFRDSSVDESIMSIINDSENEKYNMLNNKRNHGFCGIVNGECTNIYNIGEDGDYLMDPYPSNNIIMNRDVSEYQTIHANQSALDYLSPHITNFATSEQYDYSNFISFEDHTFNEGEKDENYSFDNSFNISNYGIAKNGQNASNKGALNDLSIANITKEGNDIYKTGIGVEQMFGSTSRDTTDRRMRYPWEWDREKNVIKYSVVDGRTEDAALLYLYPTRINPPNSKLNDDMRNRCHPILWDGPVDFFYENYESGANEEERQKTTISSSCYLRKYTNVREIRQNIQTPYFAPLVPYTDYGINDYSIKSTPLYYDKGRKLNGGTITTSDYDNDDKDFNILNPGNSRDGLIYAYRWENPDMNVIADFPYNNQFPQATPPDAVDSGFADAAIFPLIDRVRGCFNDSLIYPEGATKVTPLRNRASNPNTSALGLSDSNVKNERDQCIFHYQPSASNIDDISIRQASCVNACLNHPECDLVRMNKDQPTRGHLRCELLKWNKLPDNITTKVSVNNAYYGDNIDTPLYDESNPDILKSLHLGGHLINAKSDYDQSTKSGVVSWLNRITKDNPTELDQEITVDSDGKYRTEFYSQDETSDIRDWRLNHLYKTGGTPGDTVDIKGRPLWTEGQENDNEVWISMNKIRVPKPDPDGEIDGGISDIFNSINANELPNNGIQSIDSGDEWRFSYAGSTAINEESTYYTNDSSTTYSNKYNEKTVIDNSNNHKQCPSGTYVQDSDGSYKCSQVINECASCKDIYDYHDKKGDFEGMNDDAAKNNLLNSYGDGGCSVSNDDTVSGNFMVYIDKTKSIWGNITGAMQTSTPNKIMDSTGLVTKKTNQSGSTFPNQHNLMAKTPDGNIIDAEKCICPGTKNAQAWVIGSGPNIGHGIAVCA